MKTDTRDQDETQVTTLRTTDLDGVTGGWIPLVVAGVGAVVVAGTAIWTAGHSKGMADSKLSRRARSRVRAIYNHGYQTGHTPGPMR